MSFVAELKQRKVFRVATVYLVAAWIAVQAASIALPAFDAPPWMLRVVILLLALGFPIALLLAWAIDWTPEGLKPAPRGAFGKRMAAIAAAFALLAFAWFFYGQPALRWADIVKSNASAEPAARSIAVLPFVNMSGDSSNDYFSDGLAETTLDMLAQVPDLKVVARTSSFSFKGQSVDVRKIGAALGAATVLEGSVQRAGDAVRITTQLVRASDGFHLWSRRFDRQLSDVFKIQDEVATEVVRSLQVSLDASDRQRLTQKRTENVEAYQEYLKGVALLPDRKVADMRAAAGHFERAIALDPDYARAYVAAADTYGLLYGYSGSMTDEERQRIIDYVDRALKLAPDLGEAHAALATRLDYRGEMENAEREYRRAIELAPSYASAYQWYGEFLSFHVRDFAGAERLFKRAVMLDPLSPIVQDQLVYQLIASSNLDTARVELAKLQREHPDFAQGYYTQALLGTANGDLVAMLRGLREHAARDPAAVSRFRSGCFLIARFGATDQALRCIDDLARRWPDDDGIAADRIQLSYRKSAAELYVELKRQPSPEPMFEAYLLLCLNRHREALDIVRAKAPQLFAEPAAVLYPRWIPAAVIGGYALARTGAEKEGRAMLENALTLIRARPINAALDNTSWWEVRVQVALGERDQALDTIERRVAAGALLDLVDLDTDPLLAALRADSRYASILVPARERAATQVKAAEEAGLFQAAPVSTRSTY